MQMTLSGSVSESKRVTALPNESQDGELPFLFSAATQKFLLASGNWILSWELVVTPTMFPALMILSRLTYLSSASPSQSSSLLHSQPISCWMNTAMFVSQTSASPVTFPRRSLTPACKCLCQGSFFLCLCWGSAGDCIYNYLAHFQMMDTFKCDVWSSTNS